MQNAPLEMLWQKYVSKTATKAEIEELFALLNDAKAYEDSTEILIQRLYNSQPAHNWDDAQWNEVIHKITSEKIQPPAVRKTHFLRPAWLRYAAAALIIILGFAAFLRYNQHARQIAKTNSKKGVQTDIAPGSEKAVLTLADGSKLVLDNAANGNLAQQGNARVVKLANGQIVYNVEGLPAKEAMWNTMSTPIGGQYRVTLPDGTRVWLNAASSVTFPAAFAGKERRVKVTGEVYMEVAKNKQQPFIVEIDQKVEVRALGTSFNINSYADEASIKTSLVEGSVKVKKDNQDIVLTPGYQAVIALPGQQPGNNKNAIHTQPVDLNKTLAWKNGIFDFTGADLRSVMRQLERWYDIKVQYKSSTSTIIFEGSMYRNVNLSDVLEVLQKMGVKFELQGRDLIIL